jgi:hypothetical protein
MKVTLRWSDESGKETSETDIEEMALSLEAILKQIDAAPGDTHLVYVEVVE